MIAYYEAERDAYGGVLVELREARRLNNETRQRLSVAGTVAWAFRNRPAVQAVGAGGLQMVTGYTSSILTDLVDEKLRAEIANVEKWLASAEGEIRRYEQRASTDSPGESPSLHISGLEFQSDAPTDMPTESS